MTCVRVGARYMRTAPVSAKTILPLEEISKYRVLTNFENLKIHHRPQTSQNYEYVEEKPRNG